MTRLIACVVIGVLCALALIWTFDHDTSVLQPTPTVTSS